MQLTSLAIFAAIVATVLGACIPPRDLTNGTGIGTSRRNDPINLEKRQCFSCQVMECNGRWHCCYERVSFGLLSLQP